MSDGMGRELAYLSSHATNRYFIPNWGNIMKVYGIETNGGGVLVDSDKKEYGIFNYTGHIGGAHYFYIKPGTYTIKSLSATNGNYIYLEYGNVRQPLSAGRTFTVPASFFSIVFSKKAL